jgi:hypothetical protein
MSILKTLIQHSVFDAWGVLTRTGADPGIFKRVGPTLSKKFTPNFSPSRSRKANKKKKNNSQIPISGEGGAK